MSGRAEEGDGEDGEDGDGDDDGQPAATLHQRLKELSAPNLLGRKRGLTFGPNQGFA
jgi:hypothetical protein